jgi:glutamate-ammonia-ligase adenylyltransferase
MTDYRNWFDVPAANFAKEEVGRYQTQLADHADAETLSALERVFQKQPERLAQFQKVLVGSEFAARLLCGQPRIIFDLLTSEPLNVAQEQMDYAAALRGAVEGAESDTEWDSRLRRLRNRAMIRIIWRDFNRLADTQATMGELSALARSCIQASLDYHFASLAKRLGVPRDARGEQQGMLVLGMGKLGAGELNLSSDIDLIFSYPSAGETDGEKQLSNHEFFARLGQRIIKSLDALTADGFVFRVDMRLRPYGQSGALVSSFDALEDYYQTQGREWERYAMIKARIVASNAPAGAEAQLMSILRSFTFRRYVDFSAIDALRNLKQMIRREVQRRGKHDDVKLGAGGIREIEFVAQAFQLIRGGRDLELQDNRILRILPLLRELGCLPEGVDSALVSAYLFLRDTEHAIQGFQDRQTQALPTSDTEKARLAYVMGYDSWQAFNEQLQGHRERVQEEFQAVIDEPEQEASPEDQRQLADWEAYWRGEFDDKEEVALLAHYGHEDSERSRAQLQELRESPVLLAMHSAGRERLDAFMPRLLGFVSATDAPSETLARILKLVTSVARRSAYLLLLIENPDALKQLVELSTASPWIANQLALHPALLDELLDSRTLYSVPSTDELEDELRRAMLRIDPADLEGQMDALRYFRSAHALRVAACEVKNTLPLMRVSDYLTELAEVILNYVLHLAWDQMVARHGYPSGTQGEEPDFIIIGYGKLGGIELGHGSDLDLVFVHDADPNGATDGERSLDNVTFYMRLGQKIIHILDTNTLAGKLYEVDMRLRPNGNSGMLVSSFRALEKYQKESAWTWEHQALVRARVVAGSARLTREFERVREEVLTQQREPEKLKSEVKEMRHKMRTHLGSSEKGKEADQFHLKQDAGGIVDIEFMVQYAVLAWAHADPTLVRYTDNIRILGCLEQSGLLDTQEVSQLIEAYKAFRSAGHRLALQQQSSLIDGSSFTSERQTVQNSWQRLLGDD